MTASNDITLTEGKNIISDQCEISQTFNKHYINIVEKSCGTTLRYLNDSESLNYTKTI